MLLDPHTEASAFGLAVRATPAPNGRRAVVLREASRPLPRTDGWDVLSELRRPDGEPELSVHAHPRRGFLLRAPGIGDYLVAADGGEIAYLPAAKPLSSWRRLLTAEALPLAAVLQGLEVLRASAVTLPCGVIAITGGSAVGKTSVAVRLVLRGATFHADDAVAVEPRSGDVLAHPGAAAVNVRHSEARRLGRERLTQLGRVVERDRWSVRVAVDGERAPRSLRALYILERGADVPRVICRPICPADPRLLLAAMLNRCVRTPRRLARHIDVAARLARDVRLVRVLVPRSATAGAVADVIESDVRGWRDAA